MSTREEELLTIIAAVRERLGLARELVRQLAGRGEDVAGTEVTEDADRLVDDWDGGECRVCGCTQNDPCEPPCGWAEDDLCSACVDVEEDA